MRVRPATESELRFVHHSWRKSWRHRREHTANNRHGSGRVFMWGPGAITQQAASAYLDAFIKTNATTATVLVAAVEAPVDEPGNNQPLAWVCRDLVQDSGSEFCAVHFAYTVKAARRRGWARGLLEYVMREAATAGVPVEATHINGRGAALMESVKQHEDPRDES